MRSEFCNWFEKRHGKNPHHFTEDYADYTYLKHETGKAWQHQQSKIDELQKIINASNKVLESMRKELEHGHLSDDQYKTLSIYADDLEQALKGDE